jgi:hypothetical protein
MLGYYGVTGISYFKQVFMGTLQTASVLVGFSGVFKPVTVNWFSSVYTTQDSWSVSSCMRICWIDFRRVWFSKVTCAASDARDYWLGTWILFLSTFIALLLEGDYTNEDAYHSKFMAMLLVAFDTMLILSTVIEGMLGVAGNAAAAWMAKQQQQHEQQQQQQQPAGVVI